MKSFAVAALVSLAAAQSISSLPACGKVCINNMLAAAPQLGCPLKNGQPDTICLCSNVDFGYGFRDCVNESCPAGTNTTSILDFGIAYCKAALASASGSAITTKPIVSTKSDGSKTTIGSTTIYSSITAAAGSASSSKASEASSKSASASSVASSAEASASSIASSAASAASSVAASASSAASAGASSAASAGASSASAGASSASAGASSASAGASSASSSAGAVPMVTVAAQAFVGLAGLAAAFAL